MRKNNGIMSEILASEIDKLLNKKTLDWYNKLFLLEKERRGIDKNKLVFIAIANIASYYWCALLSLIHEKEMDII